MANLQILIGYRHQEEPGELVIQNDNKAILAGIEEEFRDAIRKNFKGEDVSIYEYNGSIIRLDDVSVIQTSIRG